MVLQIQPITKKSEQSARFTPKVQKIFDESFEGINLSRKKFMFALMCALIEKKSVRFDDLAKVLNFDAKEASNKRRIQAFFADFELLMFQVSFFIMLLVPLRKFRLSLDRTNWKFGKQNFNILTLCIEYKGVGIPIYWDMLDKQGNSNEEERIILLKKFIKQFGTKRILNLSADREFIGKKWFTFLIETGIVFYIRIRHNFEVYDEDGQLLGPAAQLANKYRATFRRNVTINGVKVHVAAKRLTVKELKKQKRSNKAKNKKKKQKVDDKYLIVITNDDEQKAFAEYKKRWVIEVFFQSVKSSGFNLEKTHLTKLERFNKLFALVAMTFTCCLIIGLWKDQYIATIPINNHGYKQNSFFRVGLDTLQTAIRIYRYNKGKQFEQIINYLYQYMFKIYYVFNLHNKIIT